jgi:predicted Zn-dependent protease
LGEKEDINLAKHREAKNYIQKAPYLPNGYIDLAESYVADKQYHKAVGYLEKALTLATDENTKQMIYYDLALSYFYMDDIDASKSYIEKAFLLKTSEELEFLAAKISAKEGKNQEAIMILEDLISKHPDNIDYTIALANIYVNSKEYFKARKVLKNYTKRCPNEKNNPRFSSYGILML